MKAYIYGHPSGAHFVSEKGRSLEILKGDKFEIGSKDGRYYVVQDGKGIRITTEEKRSLIRQSSQLKPAQDHLDRLAFLYSSRKAVQEACINYLTALSSKGVSDVTPFYERMSVGASAKCSYGFILLTLSANVVGVSLYCKDDKRLKAALKSDLGSALKRRASRLSAKLLELDTDTSISVEAFRPLSMHMGNIKLPVLGSFTGRCFSYNASWKFED